MKGICQMKSQWIWAETIADTNKVSFRTQKADSYHLKQTISYTSIFLHLKPIYFSDQYPS